MFEKLIKMLEENDLKLDYDDAEFIADELDLGFGSGCTRFGFIFKEEKVCVKIPRYREENKNYCEMEIKHYNSAKDYGIEQVLLAIEKITTTKNGVEMYQQPKYDFTTSELTYDNANDEMCLELQKIYQNKKSVINYFWKKYFDGCISKLWLTAVYKAYGGKFLLNFCYWVYHNDINDLHSDNTGFLNNLPVILDYAGFYCE